MQVDLRADVPGFGQIAITGTVAEMVGSDRPDPLIAVQSWLDNIDAGELERVALEAMGMRSDSFVTEVLQTLRRWAGGTP